MSDGRPRPPFSRRSAWDRDEHALAIEIAAARASGRPLIDLTETNPTRVGLIDGSALVAELGHPRGAAYAPEALGHPVAREAVAAYLCSRGVDASAARVVIGASTSEAYAWLFQVLADHDDEILVPSPSYPLFAWLASLAGVRPVAYPLARDAAFRLDRDELARLVGPRTRAVVVVHPNNPTGTLVRHDDAAWLIALAAERGLAIVADEVFGEHLHGPLADDRRPTFAGETGALTFAMSGLSKLALSPQLKLGWTLASGPDALVREALARLEVVADTFLSVSTPVQLALPAILSRAPAIVAATRARLCENLGALDAALASAGPGAAVRRLPTDAGWTAILEVPRTRGEDEWVRSLLDEGVIVQPGWYFDLDREGFLVISLLPAPRDFAEAIARVVATTAHG